jgi:type I site-specific restriction-modification system R (restriction) subunit
MQAIARVNRVYENIKEGKKKEFGLVVDYNNI